MKPRYIIALGVFLVGFWLFWGDILAGTLALSQTSELSGNDMARVGQWGDSFGAMNALFSAAAFAVVVGTLLVQSRSIQAQAEDLHRQRFESSFFELLRLMRELRNEMIFTFTQDFRTGMKPKYPTSKKLTKRHKGFNAVRAANIEMHYWIRSVPNPSAKMLSDIYEERIHKRYEMTIAPYFRLIYTILYRIKTDKVLSQAEKFRYGNLLRSQLTSEEIKLLAFNGLAVVSKDLDKLIAEFRMLKYLPHSSVRNKLKGPYPDEAFAARD